MFCCVASLSLSSRKHCEFLPMQTDFSMFHSKHRRLVAAQLGPVLQGSHAVSAPQLGAQADLQDAELHLARYGT